MNLITSIWAKRGDEAEGADHAAGNTGAIAREDLASALAAHHEADLAELPEEERAEAVEVMVDSYIAARDVRTQTAAAIAEGAPADLAAEVAFAREYAGSSADDAERRVREYAASWGTPDRETTVRIARDAAGLAHMKEQKMTIDLFEDNAGGLHIVDRARGIGFHGFERGQNLAAYRVTGRTEFTMASDAPAFDDLGEGSLYEPTDAADIEALYLSAGERDAAALVARWEAGEITIFESNLGASARWYLEIA